MTERVAKLRKLLALDPADTFLLYGLAQEHAKLGEHADALALYDRLLSIDPNYFYAYYFKAKALVALARLSEARQAISTGLHAATAAADAKAANELAALELELRAL